MRIGIDVEVLKVVRRDGLYVHLWNLLAGLHTLATRPNVQLFFWKNWTAETLASARASFPGFRAVRFNVPGAPYRLRVALSPLGRLDVFQYLTCSSFPVVPGRLNSFLIPDLTPIHMPECHTKENGEHFRSMYAMAKRHANLVITYSEHTRQDVAGTLGIPIERILAIPLAAAPHYRPLPEAEVRRELARWGLEYGGYILSTGTLEPRKNHQLLLRAYARVLSARRVPPLPLVLAGGKGWRGDEVFATAARLGLQESVRFLGFVDQLAPLYNGARVVVYPSLFEGFGLPPLEAMACGAPVIASNATSLPEVVGDAGVMMDPSDADGLAAALESIMGDNAAREQLRAKGLARAATFSWRRCAEELLACYRALHSNRAYATTG